MRRPALASLLGALVAAACFTDRFPGSGSDGLSDAGSAGSTDQSATTAGSSTTTSTGSDTGGVTTSTQTTSAGTGTAGSSATSDATTTAAQCGALGDPCGDGCCGCLACTNGHCTANADACGACQTCAESGDCVPTAGAECVAADPVCEGKIWGIDGTRCLRFAGRWGTCDGSAQCTPNPESDCGGQGSTIAECTDAECIKPDVCVALMDANTVLDVGLCASGPTEGCGDSCSDMNDGSVLYHSLCGVDGICGSAGQESCKGYKCAGPTACAKSCQNDSDCALGFACDFGACN